MTVLSDLLAAYSAEGEISLRMRSLIEEVANQINGLADDFAVESGYVTPELYGAAGDGVTDDTAALTAALAATPAVQLQGVPGKTYLVSSGLSITKDYTVWKNIHLVYTSSTTLNALLAVSADYVTIDGCTFTTPISQVYLIEPAVRNIVYVNRPSDGPDDGTTDLWKNNPRKFIKIINNRMIGGNLSLNTSNLVHSQVQGNLFYKPYEFGYNAAQHTSNTLIQDNMSYFSGRTECIRLGTDYPENVPFNIFIKNNIGLFDGRINRAALQESFDIFCKTADNIQFEGNTAIGSGAGLVEWKVIQDTAGSTSRYDNSIVRNNRCVNFGTEKGIWVRLNANPTNDPERIARGALSGNLVTYDPWSREAAGTDFTLSLLSGSRHLTVTLTNHRAQPNDWCLPQYLFADGTVSAQEIGGIPLHLFQEPLYVLDVIDLNNFRVVMPQAATSTVTNWAPDASAKLYCKFSKVALGANPLATTNGSAIITITDPTHSLVNGQAVDIQGAEAVGGFTYDQLNRTGAVVSGVTGTTYTIQMEHAATSTATGGGSNVFVKPCSNNGGSAYLFGQLADFLIKDNSAHRSNVFMTFETTGGVDTVDPIIRDLLIESNVSLNGGAGFLFQRGKFNHIRVINNHITGKDIALSLDIDSVSGLQQFSNCIVSGNTFEVRHSRTTTDNVRLCATTNLTFTNNTLLGGSEGVYYRVSNRAGSDAPSGNRFFYNTIDVSRTAMGTRAMRLSAGETGARVHNNMLYPRATFLPLFAESAPSLQQGLNTPVFTGELTTGGVTAVAANGTNTVTVTVPGAKTPGMYARATYLGDLAGVVLAARVTADDTVVVTLSNPTLALINVPAGTFVAEAIQRISVAMA